MAQPSTASFASTATGNQELPCSVPRDAYLNANNCDCRNRNNADRNLRKQPLCYPRRVHTFAAVEQPLVQPERPVAPELDGERPQTKARPMRRTRDARQRIFCGIARDFLFKCETPFQRPRLARSPGPDLAILRARGEIGVGFRVADRHHVAPRAYLAAQRLPVK